MTSCSILEAETNPLRLCFDEKCIKMGTGIDTEKRCEKLIEIIENERRNHDYSRGNINFLFVVWRYNYSLSTLVKLE